MARNGWDATGVYFGRFELRPDDGSDIESKTVCAVPTRRARTLATERGCPVSIYKETGVGWTIIQREYPVGQTPPARRGR